MRNQITLLHVSDLHFSSDSIRIRDLLNPWGMLSKRSIGRLNYRLRRKNHFPKETRNRLIKRLESWYWDYLVISGDLTTLALEREFIEARDCLEPLIRKGTVILTAGNHDRYLPQVVKPDLIAKYFGDCFPFAPDLVSSGNMRFLELGEKAVLFELDMSVPRSWISSRGKIRVSLKQYEKELSEKYTDRLKIAVGHYPVFLPANEHEGYFHSLEGKDEIGRFLFDNRVGVYLHGHIHKTWSFKPKDSQVLVCVNSGGCCRHDTNARPGLGFHRLEINGDKVSVEKIDL